MTLTVWNLITAIFLALPGIGTMIERQPIVGSPFEYAEDGTRRVGALACWDRSHIVLFWSDALTEEGEAHEYMHGLDCADDGLLNGSPGWPRPASYEEALAIVHRERPGVLSSADVWYAWAGTMGPEPVPTADAEWCAVMATLTGRLQP